MSRETLRRKRSKRLNWNKFTDFRSRNTRDDLEQICAGLNQHDLEEVFTTHDETGLCPIHWAAIHNRSDLISYMIANRSPMRIKCKNKLFADGTALHLAAMNGSIEAADVLLDRCDTQNQVKVKTLKLDRADTTNYTYDDGVLSWLNERDAEGQTVLLRSAAPQTKRLATVRDLLRKNFWSLSSRPAEMALFLINKGADWRDVDSNYGMNLLHLAIVNDYSDIVNLLLVIDSSLATKVVKKATQIITLDESNRKTIDSNSQASTSEQSSNPSSRDDDALTTKPLIRREKVKSLISTVGLTPLQLAIVYGRLSIIDLIWHTNNSSQDQAHDNYQGRTRRGRNKSSAVKSEIEVRSRKEEFRNILLRSFLANKNEIVKLLRTSSLRFLLAVDLIILTLIWMPVYLTNLTGDRNVLFSARGGVFITSYCVTLALAFRVILKNPGYLRRYSVQYMKELVQIVGTERIKMLQTETNQLPPNATDSANQQQTEPPQPQQQTTRELSKIVNLTYNHNQMKVTDRVRLLCHKCRCIRKARSRHCNYCDHCIQDFDHHCAYLGCCIGRKNRLDFLLMLVMLTLTSTYGTMLHVTSLKRNEWNDVWHFVGLLWILKYALIGFFSTFFMLRRACLGVTMFESIRSGRIMSIFGPNGPPESIRKSHSIYSVEKGSFWRHTPDRFLSGEMSMKKILHNLSEFTNHISFSDYFLTVACADTALAKSLVKGNNQSTKIDLYKLV